MKASEVIRTRVPPELKLAFESLAANHGLTASHVLRQIMKEYVDQETELARRQEETLEALEDIEVGRVVGGDEVMAWLASWGKDDELEPPE